MTTRRTLTALGIATAFAMAVCTLGTVQAQGQPTRATITLSMSNGACTKTLVGNGTGGTIRAKRGTIVQWQIINNCSAASAVGVGDWAVKGGAANSPFTTNGRANCSANPGQQCNITLNIRDNAGLTTYSYSVSVNGTVHDPDLIIEG